MVLTELGSKLTSALAKFSKARGVDATVVQELVKDVSLALIKADVNASIIRQLKRDLLESIDLDSLPPEANHHAIVQQTLIRKIVELLDPGTQPKQFQRGRANVVMFVGLQGSGKTTTIAKFGKWHKRRGWRVGFVCADTFRAGAFDQLKQNAEAVKIPFYGSYEERDPVKIAAEGVRHFQNAGVELIVVDTSGRHRQSEALFKEMEDVASVIEPDETIFVMDATIGQAAQEQAAAFRDTVDVGSIIITKLDGNAKGGGAISAIAATRAPITFIGTGEGFDSLEPFTSESFVSRMLGFGDMRTLVRDIQQTVDQEQQREILIRASKGDFSLRDFRVQIESILKLGPIDHTIGAIPGFSELIARSGETISEDIFLTFLHIMDSMTERELSSLKLSSMQSRKERIARGSGTSIEDVDMLFTSCKQMTKLFEMFLSRGGKQVNPAALAKGMKKSRRGAKKGVPRMPTRGMPQMPEGMPSMESMMRMMGNPRQMARLQEMMTKGLGDAG